MYLREAIQRDLASFADPRSEVTVTDHEATWTQARQMRRLKFMAPLTALTLPTVAYDGREYDYAGFFASEWMADLQSLAQELPYALKDSPNFVEGVFIPPKVTATEDSAPAAADAVTEMAQLVAPTPGQTRSRLIFLQGRAGDGKSALLTHLAHDRAVQYQKGQATWLYFYIDAQGRALARIDEAVAAIIQDLRARFTYHGLSTLTRLGLLVPVIDGFDELLGSGGYDDAFASLEAFVRRLHGAGSLIASARSTFYKYSAIGRAAARFSNETSGVDLEVHPVFLRQWTDAESGDFLVRAGVAEKLGAQDPSTAASEARRTLGAAADEILSSPFLLNQFAEHLQSGTAFDPNVRFLHGVIRSLVRRELVAKILDTFGNPILDEHGHVAVLGALAEEMWWQESRVVDEDTFRTVCELSTETLGLSPGSLKTLLERLPSHAVLSRTTNPVRISFRHEYYYAYFLGEHLANEVIDGVRADAMLASSRVTVPIATEFAASINDEDGTVRRVLDKLSGIRRSASSSELVSTNAGTLSAALLRTSGAAVPGAMLRGMIFEAEDLSRTTLSNVVFSSSSFLRVDLCDVRWTDIQFQNCSLVLPIFSDSSALAASGIRVSRDVVGVVLRRGTDQVEYDPARVQDVLRRVGLVLESEQLPVHTDAQSERISQLKEFLRVVQKTLCFSEEDFRNRGKNINDFRDLLKLAERSGVIVPTKRSASGLRASLYRLRVDPEDLRSGQSGVSRNESVRSFWADLLS
jgi:hypothetical protein